MKTYKIKAAAATLLTALATAQATAQIPTGYYDALKGKTGAELKTAVHNIIKNAKVLEYGSGSGSTWYGFYTTDNDNGYVVDRYSNNRVKFGAQGDAPEGLNIEHSFPKSWWGKTKTQAYMDLYNLMPSDINANSAKSNYGMGIVVQTAGKGFYDNGCIKVGTGSEGFSVWQPSEEWEGDFSRSYMYMATAYQDYTWTGTAALNSLQQGDYPTLKEWASKLYITWAKADPVSELEVRRNNAVCKIQGNRNPFVDFPNLMEYVWGDSIGYAFDPSTTVASEKYTAGGGSSDPSDPQPGAKEEVLYTANYKQDGGGCIVEAVKDPSEAVAVWTLTESYGWKASGYLSASKKNTESDGYVVTPEIDLSEMQSATLSFTHAVNFCSSPAKYLSVEVRCEGSVEQLDDIEWPAGSNWKFVGSGDVDLSRFAGKKVQIAFHYTSDGEAAATWEVSDACVKGVRAASGIKAAIADGAKFDPSLPYTVYSLSGSRTDGKADSGIVIVRQKGKTFKMPCSSLPNR